MVRGIGLYFSTSLFLNRGRHLPTVHLSLPDSVYRELKKKAGEIGIQVTDLIKLFIQEGLKHGLGGWGGTPAERRFELIEKRLDELDRKVARQQLFYGGRIVELNEMIRDLYTRLEQIEEILMYYVGSRKNLTIESKAED